MLRGEGKENGEKTTIGLKQKSNFVCTPESFLDISLSLFFTTTK